MICQAWKDLPDVVISNCWGTRAGLARNEIEAMLIHVACVLRQLDLKYCYCQWMQRLHFHFGLLANQHEFFVWQPGHFCSFLRSSCVRIFDLDVQVTGHNRRGSSASSRPWLRGVCGEVKKKICRAVRMQCVPRWYRLKCFVERCQFMRLRWYCTNVVYLESAA